MRDSKNVFHLAIPCADLDAAHEFYVQRLGCEIARRYDDRITLNFFGDQVVCHLSPEDIDPAPKMYPRHFGITFRERDEYEALLARAEAQQLKYFSKPFIRFAGKREEHQAFFLIDPSNNLLEFKYYADPAMMY